MHRPASPDEVLEESNSGRITKRKDAITTEERKIVKRLVSTNFAFWIDYGDDKESNKQSVRGLNFELKEEWDHEENRAGARLPESKFKKRFESEEESKERLIKEVSGRRRKRNLQTIGP